MLLFSRLQNGMVLLVSLVFLLLLSLTGVASMVGAARQEKLAGSVQHANYSLQAAEAALRRGESWLQIGWPGVLACTSPSRCNPPVVSRTQQLPGIDPVSGVHWVQTPDGLYGIQSLGLSVTPADLPVTTSTRLYRVTGIGLRGQSRSVLESIYAHYQDADDDSGGAAPAYFRRIMWRQIQ